MSGRCAACTPCPGRLACGERECGRMSRDERTLLEHIRLEPEDDTLRLVYADWLEENADADRAEFIRLQVESASACYWGEHPGHFTRRFWRERELSQRHGPA